MMTDGGDADGDEEMAQVSDGSFSFFIGDSSGDRKSRSTGHTNRKRGNLAMANGDDRSSRSVRSRIGLDAGLGGTKADVDTGPHAQFISPVFGKIGKQGHDRGLSTDPRFGMKSSGNGGARGGGASGGGADNLLAPNRREILQAFLGGRRSQKQITAATRKQPLMKQPQIVSNMAANQNEFQNRKSVPRQHQIIPLSEDNNDAKITDIVVGDFVFHEANKPPPKTSNQQVPQLECKSTLNGLDARVPLVVAGIAETMNLAGSDGMKSAASVVALVCSTTVINTGPAPIPVGGVVGLSFTPYTIPTKARDGSTVEVPGVVQKGTNPLRCVPATYHVKYTDVAKACSAIMDHFQREVVDKVLAIGKKSVFKDVVQAVDEAESAFFHVHDWGLDIQPLHSWYFWHAVSFICSPLGCARCITTVLDDVEKHQANYDFLLPIRDWLPGKWRRHLATLDRVLGQTLPASAVHAKRDEFLQEIHSGPTQPDLGADAGPWVINIVQWLQKISDLASREKVVCQEAQQAYIRANFGGIAVSGAHSGSPMDIVRAPLRI